MLKVILIVIKVAIVVLLMYMVKEHASNIIYNKDSNHVIDCLAFVVYFIGICIYVGEIILLVCHVGG